ncbi:MAG: ATP-binding cassette domain-containing protein, partial [Limnochordia bacterium]|nr:ATP-binding cassette domain-containing protein [Limnochordia bacterium]
NLFDLFLFILRSLTAMDVFFVLGISLLVSLLGMFLPFMNKQIFDSVIPSGTKGDLLPVAVLMVGATVGASLFTMARTLVLMRLRDKINIAVQNAAMARLFTLPVSFFKDYSAGEISERAMSINALSSMLTDTVLTSGLTALFSFVYIFQMASFAPVLVVPALLSILAILVFSILTGFARQRISRKQTKLSAKMSGLIFNLLGGAQKIKLAGAEKRAFAKWARQYKEVGKLIYAPPFFLRLNDAISGALFLGGALLLYYVAGASRVSPSDYIAFNIAYGTVSGAILALSGVALTFANIRPLLEMVEPILNTAPEINESKIQITTLSGRIEVSNVTFSYSDDGPLVLNKLNLKVEPGEYLAIVGKSGCGKSTLMRLLLGFEQPNSGAIYYDGYDLKTLDMRSVRQCIGVDLQNGKLFSGDIFSNIIITSPTSTLDDAWEAAYLAGVDEDIRKMPMGMHTMISEGTGGISGGQRQRLLIARALISKPRILLFDEATSALDNITQQHVTTSLASLGCSRVVIAHRLSTVKDCDRIVVIDRGEIVEEGTYEELMAQKGLFHDFAARQIA